MIKFKINDPSKSDVTKMFAKKWRMTIYGKGTLKENLDIVHVEKDDVLFVIYLDKDKHNIIVDRFIDDIFIDRKSFHDDGDGVVGTFCILEGETSRTTYAFFRTEKLQQLMDQYGIRISFSKESGNMINKFRIHQSWDNLVYGGTVPEMPPFHTDGTFTCMKNEDRRENEWIVSGATYIYGYPQCILYLPQDYDLEHIKDVLEEIIQ